MTILGIKELTHKHKSIVDADNEWTRSDFMGQYTVPENWAGFEILPDLENLH